MPSYSYDYQPLRVYFDGAFQPDVQVKTIRRSAGGNRIDTAEMEVKLDKKRLREGSLGFNGAALPNVEITTALGRVLFAGKLTQTPVTFNQSVEHMNFVARLEPFCFGDPVGFLPQYCAVRPPAFTQFIHRDLIFNPEIDDRVRGNRFIGEFFQIPGVPTHAFLEYDSTRTERSWRQYGLNQDPSTEWAIFQITYYLCWVLNPTQEFVRNPATLDELDLIFSRNDAVRNFKVRHGDYLPDVLDDLLKPRGYDWFIEHQSAGQRVLRFYRRGTGYGNPAVATLSQAGGILDPARDNCCGGSFTYDQGNISNRVRVRGARRQYEITVELQRGWDQKYDSVANSDFEALREDAGNVQFRDVWRKWVLNESGDYTGLRPEITDYFDLAALLGLPSEFWIPRRRTLLPCITRGIDDKPAGDRGGCVVEYFDVQFNEWRVIAEDMPFHLLEDECGILFTGQYPPEQLLGVGSRVRVTATLEADAPLMSSVATSQASPTSDRIPLSLDMSDYFFYRVVTEQSQFHSRVQTGELRADQIDDSLPIETYAARVLDAWDYGPVNGSLVIEGVDRWNFELGQPVPGVSGRGFDFNGRSGGAADPKYPVIVGITYECQQQKTYLTIEQFRRHTLPEVG